ncbi:MAG: GatB/YqeY domain-containing protein [Vicinamibacterales bacterium]
MSLTDTMSGHIAQAMKAKDTTRLTALRMLKTALTNRSIEKGRALDDAEELQVVNALVKQRRDSIEQFEAAGRMELAARERAEIDVLDTFLPPAASDADVETAVEAAITSTGATSAKDMGKVMKAVMSALAGKTVDGKRVNELVRRKLG